MDELPTWILPSIAVRPSQSLTSTRLQAVVAGAEGYVNLLRNLASSSGIYAVATLISPLVSLVLAPFLTRYLTLEEYGALALLNTVISLAAGISQLGLGSAFFRAYNYDFTSRAGKRSVVATITIILMILSSLLVSFVALNAHAISMALFQRDDLTQPIVIAAGAVLMQNLTVPGFAWLRAEGKALWFSLFSILNLGVSLIANIVLVGVLQLGLTGSLLATASGYACVTLLTLPFLIIYSRLLINRAVALSVLAFGAPMVFNVISFWILQLSDRYLLAVLSTLSATASYAIAYNLGAILNTAIMAPFTLAWPTAMFRIAKRPDAPLVYKVIFRWFSTVLLLAAFAFSIAGRMALEWLFPPSYHDAEVIVPVIAGSLVFFGIYYLFMVGANLKRKTWIASLLTTIAAALNVGLNFVLIPQFQAIGAAASTLIAYMVMALIAYIFNQRLYPVPFEVLRFIVGYGIGVVIYAVGYVLIDLWGQEWNLLVSIAGLIVFACALFFLIPDSVPTLSKTAASARARFGRKRSLNRMDGETG